MTDLPAAVSDTTDDDTPRDPDGFPVLLTNDGLDQALAFVAGCYPAQEHTPDMIRAWRARLSRYTDRTVMQAVWQLSERDGRWRMDVGDVAVACRTIANRDHLAAQAAARDNARELEPTAGGEWWRLPDNVRAQWVDQAYAQWRARCPWLAIDRGSGAVEAVARELARTGGAR